MITPESILRRHSLSLTSCRVAVLSALIRTSGSVSYRELSDMLRFRCNRTTLYRTLRTFESQGIIKKIPIDQKRVCYELPKATGKMNQHAHFICRKCKKMFCIEIPLNVTDKLPENFFADDTEITMKGICNKCSER